MSLTDALFKKKNRPASGADPAQAFGADDLTMEEIQRQTFIPPERKAPGLVHRAGAALSSLRSRIVGEEPVDDFGTDYREPPLPSAENAPVYSAGSYQSESAPDLGWENPFTDSPSARAKAPAPTPQPQKRDRYSSLPRESYPPVDLSPEYRPPAAEEPLYPPPQADFYGKSPSYAPYPENWQPAPDPQELYDPDFYGSQEPYGYPESYPEENYDPRYGGWYGTDNMPPVRRNPRPRPEADDFMYMFWSGGIVLGMVLTVFSFIYGSLI